MIENIRSILAQYTPVDNRTSPPPPYKAAVLVPLVCVGSSVSVILIHRTEDDGPHSGQMGFPGGMSELGDNGDLEATALRETAEELGIDISPVQVVGRLSELVTWTSEILVRPIVGVLPEVPDFEPDTVEVQSVHVADIREMNRSVMGYDNSYGLPGRVYPVDGRPVWGLTARVLTELFDLLGEDMGEGCE
jgi:8-oxo-dGTP pyrophosphatase MutT (NUDIX family)